MVRRVVVVGAGITGAALAAELAADADVTVLDQGPTGRLVGSTGHAPGFVGLLHESRVGTELAVSSVAGYERLVLRGLVGFDRVGCVEVALTDTGMADLARRVDLAHEHGLPATVLDADQAGSAAPALVDPAQVVGGAHYPQDGTARADVITAALRAHAGSAGVRFVDGVRVDAIDVHAGRVTAVRAGGTTWAADDVVVAAGIWSARVGALAGVDLPIVPVGHPYLYGPERSPAEHAMPFVRWPERHVYARDHGGRFGLGTYDHAALPVDDPGSSAEEPWRADLFNAAVERALGLLPPTSRFAPTERLNGLFSMTPDNLPLLGAWPDVRGLWVAAGLWVTHAGGAARRLAAAMRTDDPGAPGLADLLPNRFQGQDPADLRRRAVRLYNDIYTVAG